MKNQILNFNVFTIGAFAGIFFYSYDLFKRNTELSQELLTLKVVRLADTLKSHKLRIQYEELYHWISNDEKESFKKSTLHSIPEFIED